MDLSQILSLYAEFPMLIIASILVLGVIFINGWTDAPNAIATCISTRCIKPKAAILMAAFFNFLGVLTMFFISKQTAQTISDMVDFGTNYAVALDALCAGMIGVIAWGVLAWWFGIPSSESHALIAGITGAGLAAMTMGLDAKIEFGPLSSWALTIYGLVLSCFFGFFVGFGLTKLIEVCCRKVNRNKARPFFKRAEVVSGAAMAYVHGAQDGLKFIGVLFLAIELAAKAKDPTSTIALSNDSSLWWLAIIISLPATLVSSTITLFLFHGITSSGSAIIVQILAKLGLGKGLAVFLVQVGTDYLDRLVAIYVVSLVYKALKSRISLGVTKY